MRGRLLVALLGATLVACHDPAPRAPEPAPSDGATTAVPVATGLVRVGTVQTRIVAPGSLVARRSSQIGAEVTGRIEKVLVDVGDRVEAGDLLFEIDHTTYEAALREAEAALELARAERRQVESDLRRARRLQEERVLSTQELERVQTQLAVARAREAQADAAVEIARQNLAKTRVVAPYAGTIAQRLADEGTTARTMPQTIVVELQETGLLEARAGLPEALHARVRTGDRVRLQVEGLAEPIETAIETVADTLDPATRTFLIRMQVPNQDHRIKAGAFARVEILPSPRTEALLIPRSAVRSEAGRTSVLAVRDGRAVEVAVELGEMSEESVEVLAGLDQGERVVVGEDARSLMPGTPVVVRPSPEKPA